MSKCYDCKHHTATRNPEWLRCTCPVPKYVQILLIKKFNTGLDWVDADCNDDCPCYEEINNGTR